MGVKCKGRGQLEDQGVDRRAILKLLFRKSEFDGCKVQREGPLGIPKSR
jgi:hypothetical protein